MILSSDAVHGIKHQVFKETISTETLSKILRSIDKSFTRDPKAALHVMVEVAKRAKQLSLAYICLDHADKISVQNILDVSDEVDKTNAKKMRQLLHSSWFA